MVKTLIFIALVGTSEVAAVLFLILWWKKDFDAALKTFDRFIADILDT